MEHDDTSRATNDPQSIPTWLAQADPVAPVTATKPPRKSKRWLVFVGLPLVLTASYFAVTFISSRSNSCFDAGNYEALTALVNSVDDDTSSLSDLQSQEAFYTHAIYFQQATTAFDTDNEDDPTDFLKSIGSYYQTNHATAPITVHITTRYADTKEFAAAQARNSRVKDMLIDAGLDESAITIAAPTLVENTDTSTGEVDDDAADERLPVLVSIAPLSICTTEE